MSDDSQWTWDGGPTGQSPQNSVPPPQNSVAQTQTWQDDSPPGASQTGAGWDSTGDGFGGFAAGAGMTAGALTSAPWAFLGGAAACVAVSLALSAVASGRIALAVLAWAVGGFGSIGALTLFTMRDAQRRASPSYVRQVWTPWLYRALCAAAVLAVVASAVRIALWVGYTA